MTDQTGPEAQHPQHVEGEPTTTPPPAPTYDDAPYVAPAAPAAPYAETAPYPPSAPAAYPLSPEPAAYAPPPYAPPAYGAPGYGAGYPVQTTPGAPPVMPYGYGGYPARRTNGLAVASMILSIVGFLWILPFVGSLAGAIMGHVSLGQIKRTGEAGRGMALAGVIIGWAGVAITVLGVLFFVFVFAVSAGSSSSYS